MGTFTSTMVDHLDGPQAVADHKTQEEAKEIASQVTRLGQSSAAVASGPFRMTVWPGEVHELFNQAVSSCSTRLCQLGSFNMEGHLVGRKSGTKNCTAGIVCRKGDAFLASMKLYTIESNETTILPSIFHLFLETKKHRCNSSVRILWRGAAPGSRICGSQGWHATAPGRRWWVGCEKSLKTGGHIYPPSILINALNMDIFVRILFANMISQFWYSYILYFYMRYAPKIGRWSRYTT